MQIDAKNVAEYIEKIPEDRKEHIKKFRETILQNLPEGFVETMSYGMVGYVVPQDIYPNGYHCDPKSPLPFASFASQKRFIALYHMGIYAKPELLDWFLNEYPKHCKQKPDMGKSCIRFKKMEEIPYQLIGELMQKMSVDDWINIYEEKVKR